MSFRVSCMAQRVSPDSGESRLYYAPYPNKDFLSSVTSSLRENHLVEVTYPVRNENQLERSYNFIIEVFSQGSLAYRVYEVVSENNFFDTLNESIDGGSIHRELLTPALVGRHRFSLHICIET